LEQTEIYFTAAIQSEIAGVEIKQPIMRLIKQNIERDGSGIITLFPEEPEDMVCPPPNVLTS
jgi:eRF1 domain 1